MSRKIVQVSFRRLRSFGLCRLLHILLLCLRGGRGGRGWCQMLV